MGYEVHVVRQTDSGEQIDITLDEWNTYIASDPDFRRPTIGSTNYSENLVLLPTDSANPEDWPWIAWTTGSIHSKFPHTAVFQKLGQMARHFGAVVMSDDGDIWNIDERGRVSMEGL